MLKLALALFLFQQPNDVVSVTGTQQCREDFVVCTVSDGAIVTYQDMRVEAPTVTYNRDTFDVTAGEHVKLTRTNEELEGEQLSLNIKSKAGTMRHTKGHVG